MILVVRCQSGDFVQLTCFADGIASWDGGIFWPSKVDGIGVNLGVVDG